MIKINKTALLVISLIFLGLIGYFTHKFGGLEGRFSKKLMIQEGKVNCAPLTLCELGNPKSNKVIFLYGDSHAAQLSKAINMMLGQDYKIYFFWAQGCFFSDVYLVPKSYSQPEYCGNIPKQIAQLALGKVNIAITAQKWPGYGITSKEDVEKAILSKVKIFDLHPDKFFIVGSTLDVDLRCAVDQYHSRNSPKNAICTTSQESLINSEIFIKTTQSMTLPKMISFIYPSTVVCSSFPCQVIEGDKSLYQDASHLTTDGALKVVKKIQEIIDVR